MDVTGVEEEKHENEERRNPERDERGPAPVVQRRRRPPVGVVSRKDEHNGEQRNPDLKTDTHGGKWLHAKTLRPDSEPSPVDFRGVRRPQMMLNPLAT